MRDLWGTDGGLDIACIQIARGRNQYSMSDHIVVDRLYLAAYTSSLYYSISQLASETVLLPT